MAYASVTYTSASGTTFALTNSSGNPIQYLRQADISVTVNGVLKTLTTDYTFNSAGTAIVLNTAVSGATVVLSRTTSITDATVSFTAGSTLTAQDLNNSDKQNRFALQEFSDTYGALTTGTGDLSALGGFIGSAETWVADNAHAATTGAIDNRIDSKVTANNSVVQGYATAAAASASAASTSASNASTSASNASTSATNAASSATSAASSATSAASSAASALAAFDSFDDRYLGAKASDPTVDNDGDPLNAGDLYYNTTSSVMKVYTGSAWVTAYVPGDAANISFTPYSTIAATNVQTAVQELADEKLNLTGGTLTGNVLLDNQSDLRFGEATGHGGNWVAFQGPSTAAANVTWTLPDADGTADQALSTDGTGVLSWKSYLKLTGGTLTGTLTSTERTITVSTFDLSTGNFWTCGAIAIPNPTNAVAGTSGLIRVTAAPTSFGSNFDFPGGAYTAPTSFPAVVPYYVVSSSQILLGSFTEGIA